MDQRVSFVTLAVADLGATRRFYVDGLGWESAYEGDDVLMFRVADKVILSLWDEHAFAEEVGGMPSRGAVPPITLAHNLRTPEGVDRCLEHARAAGAEHVSDAVEREWGGYTGYFADPDGYRWEVAHNPGELGESVLP